jgi:hypothetical protein
VLSAFVLIGGYTRAVLACGATCDVPEFWALHVDEDDQLTVVSNFGLLQQRGNTFHLACEQAVGAGFITGAEPGADGTVVSTTDGLRRQTESACEFAPLSLGAGDEWALSFTSFTHADDVKQYAAVLDQVVDEVSIVERAGTGVFRSLGSFARESGLREVTAFGHPTSLFVTGQTHSPKTWHVATLEPASFDQADSGALDSGLAGAGEWSVASFPLDGGEQSLDPLGGDPESPGRLLLRAQSLSDQPSAVWSFDAASGELSHGFTLDEAEATVGFAAQGEYWFLAARGEAGGAIYRADRGSMDFEKLPGDLPRLNCLAATDESLFVCGDDFTRGAQFVVGQSGDHGESWQAVMRLGELGVIEACDADCDVTQNWLHATYGQLALGDAAVQGDGSLGPGLGRGNGAGPPADAAKSDERGESTETVRSGGGCSLGASRGAASPTLALWFVCGIVLQTATVRRRLDRHRRRSLEPRQQALRRLGSRRFRSRTRRTSG